MDTGDEAMTQCYKHRYVELRRDDNGYWFRCIYCGMCEEVCPEQAIFLRKDYAITGLSRQEMVHNKKRLYEIGGQRVGLVNKWNELK